MVDEERLKGHLENGKFEYVMCAAIHIDNDQDYVHKPFNIDKGLVYCGWRHHNIIEMFNYSVIEGIETQGFLTNKNRFLNREEAAILAKENGQYNGDHEELYSEDVW